MTKDERKASLPHRTDLRRAKVYNGYATWGLCDHCGKPEGILRGDWRVVCDPCVPNVYPDANVRHTA